MSGWILLSGGNEFSDSYAKADLAALEKRANKNSPLLVVVTAPFPTQELAFAYPDGTQALYGVNLTIQKGERVALLSGQSIPDGATLQLTAIAGITGGAGVLSLYHGFAHGKISVVASIAGTLAALIPAQGQSYGLELYVKKNLGTLTGWISYTYSRSLRRVITPFEEENINNGAWYASNFDKPHDLTLIGNYKVSTNASISATFAYSTGRPITFPEAKFDFSGNNLAYFNSRNQQRLPDFHRLDFSVNFKLNGEGKFFDGDWTFSVLNVYGRKNPFSIFFDDAANQPPQAFRLALLGIPLPSLSYAISF